jgi:hypothetical protein
LGAARRRAQQCETREEHQDPPRVCPKTHENLPLRQSYVNPQDPPKAALVLASREPRGEFLPFIIQSLSGEQIKSSETIKHNLLRSWTFEGNPVHRGA